MSSEFASFELSSPLTDRLNDLLDHLRLPFVLDTPLDLTPSLLLAILESLLQSRLPVSSSIRESRSDVAKVQAMKIFLGVLETDVLNEDIGLSDIDPRRLAAGEWEEVVFVAKLLCWLGKQMGLPLSKHTSSARPSLATDENAESRFVASPSTRSTATNSITSALSFEREYQESDTTAQSTHSDLTETRLLGDEDLSFQGNHRHRPQCIHEIEDPSFLARADDEKLLRAEHESSSRNTDDTVDAYCDCSRDEIPDSSTYSTKDHTSSTVRYGGYIQEVDAGLELRTFEARRRNKGLHGYSGPEKVSGYLRPFIVRRASSLRGDPSFSPSRPLCQITPPILGRLPGTLHRVTMHLHYWMSAQSCFPDLPVWILTSPLRSLARAEY